MTEIKDTTLIIVDCRDVNHAVKVLNRCTALCSFPAVKLLTSQPTDYTYRIEIPHIGSLIHYSIFVLKEIYKYIDTKHLLIVQRDGWILNPQSWNDEWFKYDYIGALFNQWDKPPIMGVGGFSFRSTALMKSVSNKYPDWNNNEEDAQRLQQIKPGYYEDGMIAIRLRPQLEREGFKFATIEDGAKFSAGGNPNLDYHYEKPFGSHGAWRRFDQVTGIVQKGIEVHDLPEPLA